MATAPGGDDRAGGCLRVDAEPGPGAVGPGAQLHSEVSQEHQFLWLAVGVAGHQLIHERPVRRNNDLNEPWVFVIGADGKITQRFDNVASEQEVEVAIKRLP